jgi:hypothetical protein
MSELLSGDFADDAAYFRRVSELQATGFQLAFDGLLADLPPGTEALVAAAYGVKRRWLGLEPRGRFRRRIVQAILVAAAKAPAP